MGNEISVIMEIISGIGLFPCRNMYEMIYDLTSIIIRVMICLINIRNLICLNVKILFNQISCLAKARKKGDGDKSES